MFEEQPWLRFRVKDFIKTLNENVLKGLVRWHNSQTVSYFSGCMGKERNLFVLVDLYCNSTSFSLLRNLLKITEETEGW